jgi:two-component system, OmpR family, response regulator ChvI
VCLEKRGISVDAFEDPERALQSFRAETYDVAVLDVRMPKMNGFQLYREIEKRDPHVKVRFFVAYNSYGEEFKKAFPEVDERSFIKKPASINKITKELLADLKVNTKARKTDHNHATSEI